jgi:predicted transcriptional regulator
MRKGTSARDLPPPLELLCLKALWNLQEGNVSDVQRVVGEKKPLAYTTVMTVLDRLVRRGTVSRRKVGRAFVYTPQMSRESARRLALKEFVDGYFDGSEGVLLAYLQGQNAAGPVPQPPSMGNHLDTALL